jgi:UDP-N-acetylenolpyruvoylglucosamine reductase
MQKRRLSRNPHKKRRNTFPKGRKKDHHAAIINNPDIINLIHAKKRQPLAITILADAINYILTQNEMNIKVSVEELYSFTPSK